MDIQDDELDDKTKLTENQKRNIEIFDEYALWRAENSAKSEETQKADYTNITQFLSWYGDRPILEIQRVDVLQYSQYLRTHQFKKKPPNGQPAPPPKNYSEMTQFQKKKCIKPFLRWLHEEHGIVDLSPQIKLKTPKREREIDKTLTYNDVFQLLEGCQHPRDKALVHFLLDAGVRRSELLAIKYSGVNFVEGGVEVTVPPKKNSTESRRVFCVHCTKDMRVWWESHPLKRKDSYFFCSIYKPHGKFSPQGLFTQLRKITTRAGLSEDIYPHLFRHSSATIYTMFDGMNSYKINKRYGWKLSSKMGDVYAHLTGKESDDDIRRAFGAPIKKKTDSGLEVLICPNCHQTNNVGDDRCYNCNKALSKEEIAKDAALEAEREAVRIQEITHSITETNSAQIKNLQDQHEERAKKLEKEIDKLYELIAVLTKDQIDFDAPLTEEEKQALKDNDW